MRQGSGTPGPAERGNRYRALAPQTLAARGHLAEACLADWQSSSRPGEAIVGFVTVVTATVIAYLGIKLTAWTQWVLIAIEYTGVGILAI
jgi:hypothetical protein